MASGIANPLFDVSIPSLPIRNYAASDSHGTDTPLLCAVKRPKYTQNNKTLQNAQGIETDCIRLRRSAQEIHFARNKKANIQQPKNGMERRRTLPQIICYQRKITYLFLGINE
jgi:hypothetical protein